MIRLITGLMWLLHWLPLPVLGALGRGLGWLLYALAGSRRKVGRTNLRLCFPGWSGAEREAVLKSHFQHMGRTFLEYGVLWFASPARLRRICRIEGADHLAAQQGKPVILLSAHFVGLECGGMRLAMDYPIIDIFTHQSHAGIDALLHKYRSRFENVLLIARNEGVRPVIRGVKGGHRLYYLPDQDLGARESIFVPFFGVSTATISGLSRLAKATGAVVLPVVTVREGGGYVVKIALPLADFPTDDIVADTTRMNAVIEDWARTWPEQYFWLHKRFKTRPPGEAALY